MFLNKPINEADIKKAKQYKELLENETFKKVMNEIREDCKTKWANTKFFQKRKREEMHIMVRAVDELLSKIYHQAVFYDNYHRTQNK